MYVLLDAGLVHSPTHQQHQEAAMPETKPHKPEYFWFMLVFSVLISTVFITTIVTSMILFFAHASTSYDSPVEPMTTQSFMTLGYTTATIVGIITLLAVTPYFYNDLKRSLSAK